MLKLVIAVVVVVLVVAYVANSPGHAADITNGAWNHTVNVAHGLGHFVDDLG